MILIRLLNVGLRGATLLLKFVLLFSLARLLEPGQVGLYGLLAATVLYMAGVAGLGYSLYATREIAAADVDERTPIIRDQAVFCVLAYVFVLPLSSMEYGEPSGPHPLERGHGFRLGLGMAPERFPEALEAIERVTRG